MDPQIRQFLVMLGCQSACAGLFAVFGAISGAVNWHQGRQVGTALGFSVINAYRRMRGTSLPPRTTGALVGSVDGLSFGVVVGTVLGLIALRFTPAESRIAVPVVSTIVVLVILALLLGLFAGLMSWKGTRSIGGLFLGAMTLGLSGWFLWNAVGLFYGVLAGSLLGVVLSRRPKPSE